MAEDKTKIDVFLIIFGLYCCANFQGKLNNFPPSNEIEDVRKRTRNEEMKVVGMGIEGMYREFIVIQKLKQGVTKNEQFDVNNKLMFSM